MEKLIAQQFVEKANVRKLVNDLVAELRAQSSHVTGIKPPHEGHYQKFAGTLEEIAKLRGRPLYYEYIGSGIGRGAYVELIDGSVKLDLINGIGIHLMGHSHPAVVAASIEGALSDVVMQGHLEPNQEYLRLSRKLVGLAERNSRLRHAWITTCGSMANENALKICRQKKTPARMIITFENAFAGRSTMMAEITDNPTFKVGLPEYHEVLRIPFCNKFEGGMCERSCGKDIALNKFKEHVAKHENNISCFVFEPMLGEGGYRTACREFFIPLLEFCRQKGIPIWADEVQTFTRTGEFFAYEAMGFGDYVDVVTVAKTAQNGATLFTEEFNPQPGLIAGTFAGSSSALAAGYAILEELDWGGYMGPEGKIQKIHRQFVGMLNDLNKTACKGLLRDAGGLGLMVAVTPLDGSPEKQQALLKAMYKNGLMAFGCGKKPSRVRFLLPAILASEDIDVARSVIEKSILELA